MAIIIEETFYVHMTKEYPRDGYCETTDESDYFSLFEIVELLDDGWLIEFDDEHFKQLCELSKREVISFDARTYGMIPNPSSVHRQLHDMLWKL